MKAQWSRAGNSSSEVHILTESGLKGSRNGLTRFMSAPRKYIANVANLVKVMLLYT